ncbi:MAG: carbohydrate kinase family protein [Acidobacteria bacterium]|nr:carbohydrate kinase family protein [Acidobacteriota bacterium]
MPSIPPRSLLTIGEAFEDLVFLDLERLPRAGEEIKTSRFVQTIGGGAVITAVAAARLGVRCEIWSGLSDTASARLTRERVRVTNLRRRGEPHAVSAALSTRMNRSFVTYNGVNDELESRLLARMARVRARHVHFAFYPRDCDAWADVVMRLRARGLTTSWDFGWNEGLLEDRGLADLLRALDILFINEQEALLYSRKRTLSGALDIWRSFDNPVVLKLGPRGSRCVSTSIDVTAAAPRVKVVDTTGAGDAFNGGFLAAALHGASIPGALKMGNRMGALSTRKAGGLDGLPERAAL